MAFTLKKGYFLQSDSDWTPSGKSQRVLLGSPYRSAERLTLFVLLVVVLQSLDGRLDRVVAQLLHHQLLPREVVVEVLSRRLRLGRSAAATCRHTPRTRRREVWKTGINKIQSNNSMVIRTMPLCANIFLLPNTHNTRMPLH